MKKLFLLSLICITTFFCTGCVKTSCDIEINKDNQITIANNNGVSLQNRSLPKGFYQVLEEDMDNLVKKYSNKDNNLKTYINDYSAGVISSVENLSFDNATNHLPAGYSGIDGSAFKIQKGLFKTTYKINMIYNPEVASKYVPDYYEEFKTSSETSKQFGSRLISFAADSILVDNLSSSVLTIKIPRKASKNNASMVISDNEYRWDFTETKTPVTVILEYNKYNFLPW